jgi:tRNA-dihydrouridine synthase
MRAQLACYLHGQKHASKYKTQAMEAKTFCEIDELLKAWVEQVSSDYEDQ